MAERIIATICMTLVALFAIDTMHEEAQNVIIPIITAVGGFVTGARMKVNKQKGEKK
jgi:hypothetical protein